MKKIFLFIISVFIVSTSVSAKKQIPFTVCWGNETDLGYGYPKSPTDPPLVYIEDYTLTFESYHPAYVLVLKDEDGIVVYSTVVNSTQTQVVLPSTLSGNYEIRLVLGSWVFTGWIGL